MSVRSDSIQYRLNISTLKAIEPWSNNLTIHDKELFRQFIDIKLSIKISLSYVSVSLVPILNRK